MQKTTTLNVRNLRLYPVGGYPTQYQRPYVSAVAADPMQLQNLQLDSGALAASQLIGTASQLLQYSATPVVARISGDWIAPRYSFELEVEATYPQSGSLTMSSLVMGYTDPIPADSTPDALPAQLRFFVDKIAPCSQLQPAGTGVIQVLMQPEWKMFSAESTYVQRPEDIFAGIQRQCADVGSAIDMRVALTHAPRLSRAKNTLPVSYLHAVLQTYAQALITAEFGVSEQELLSSARGYAAEPSVNQQPFFAALAQLQGMSSSSAFTWEQLQALGFLGQPEFPALVGFSEEGISCTGTDLQAQAAATFLQAATLLALEQGFYAVRLVANSATTEGSRVQLEDWQGTPYWGEQSGARLQALLSELLLKDLSASGLVPYRLEAQLDARTQSTLTLSWGGQPEQRYVLPSFASALLSPVLATAPDEYEQLLANFRVILDVVADQAEQ